MPYSNERNARSRQSGFTLIELLVVIAIIAILASILFPVFARARENARRASCMSNMKQLGLGFAQYLQDFDGRYPGAAPFQSWGKGGQWVAGPDNTANGLTTTNATPFTWSGITAYPDQGALYPYIKSTQIYICPSTPDGDKKKLSYSMNCAPGAFPESAITESSSVILLVDEDKTLNDGYYWTGSSASDRLTQIHLGGGNLLYVDGHVKFSQFIALFTDPTERIKTTGAPRFHDPGLVGSNPNGGGNCPA